LAHVPERLLVFEPDGHLRDPICLHITLEGFTCETVNDARAALERMDRGRFDAVIVHCGESAESLWFFEALRVRAARRPAPILLLASHAREADALSALETCVDDYLRTPFGMRELVARVRALLRRTHRHDRDAAWTPSPSIVRSGIVIDPARRRVQVNDRPLKLTEQEFQLLYVLAGHAGVVFNRQALLARIWGDKTFVTTRSVDALVKRVRRKLRQTVDPVCLVTVRGVGYKFEECSTTSCRESPSPSIPSVTMSPRLR
jgi:DNA-binding response OmpR family regulator